MPRPEKVKAVESIKDRLEAARAVFLTEYAGLSVKQQQELRRGLRSGGADYKVVKMTLAKRAAAELELTEIDELLVGPTALAFADDDPVPVAKALRDFAKDNERLVIKGGILGGEFLPPEKVSELADIEPREVLLAKIAGAAKAPLTNMAGLMAAFTRNAATMFAQLLEKKEPDPQAATSEDDAAAAPAAEEDTAVETAEAAVEEAPVAADESDDSSAASEPAEEAAADGDAPEASADEAAEGTAEETDDDAAAADDSAEEASDETDEEPPAADAAGEEE